jgi:hypothetical protein
MFKMTIDTPSTEEKIVHIFKNYNGTFYAEDSKDNWLGDYDTADEAYKAMKAKYPNGKVYRYQKPQSYTI